MHFQPNAIRGRSFLGNLLRQAEKAVCRWHEVDRLDAREIQAIAHDLNLSVSEFRTLARAAPSSQAPLGRRLMDVGLSEAELAVSNCDVLRDMQRVCGQCTSKARCVAHLKRGWGAAPSKYCPNEQTLRALSIEAQKRPSAEILAFETVRD